MVILNKENFALRVINNIVIVDEKNNIVFAGDNIRDIFFGSAKELKGNIFTFLKGKEEKNLLQSKINDVRESKKTQVFVHEGLKMKIILFPANYKKSDNIIISFEKEIVQTNLMAFELKERVKELQCLYGISYEINAASKLKDVFGKSIPHLINGFQHSEIISALIKFDNDVYGEFDIKRSVNSISEKIIVNGIERGIIQVAYYKDYSFLKEEHELIREVGDSLSKTIERVESRAVLEKQKMILEKKNLKLIELTEECARNRKKLETLFNAITDRVYVVESDFSISMSNKKNIDDRGNKFDSLFKREIANAAGPLSEVFLNGESITLERKINNSYFSLQAYPIFSEQDSVKKLLVICRNVTKKKELEFQILQSNKLSSLGKLVAGIAHEINNPNTFIRGNIKIIKESFNDIFPIIDNYYKTERDLKIARLNYDIFKENIPLLIEDMFEGSNRIKKIVDDLRNYAKKDEGFLTDDVDINLVINNAFRLVESQTRRMASVRLDLVEEIPMFKGNFQKLEQVIVNMIMNATQAASGPNGNVIVKTGIEENGKNVVITITDNGVGMEESIKASIFDPFFTTKREKGGTGLGLSISYGIIKEHKGRIEVSSIPEKGTVFTIILPLKTGKKSE